LNFNLLGFEVLLLSQKALFLPTKRILLVSDLHLGKIEHFRASGIGLPLGATEQTILILDQLIQQWKPLQIIFLGDLFHSRKNSAFTLFEDWRLRYSDIEMILIHGNHDIMSNQDYYDLGLKIYSEYHIGSIWLTHEPQIITNEESRFNLAGHVHPGIRLRGKGKQSLTLPCFWFGDRQGLMPAFGQFTGKHLVDIHENTIIFAIANDQVIRII
jgi:DNA ligase-associated metallophosphoesterase